MAKLDYGKYSKIKSVLNCKFVLDRETVASLRDKFGFSEQTFRRIKRSINYPDYKEICWRDAGYNKRPSKKDLIRKNMIIAIIVAALIGIGLALLPVLATM